MSTKQETTQRQQRILELLRTNAQLRVQEMSELMHVTPITIRRDLNVLSEKGFVERTHGSAQLSREFKSETRYSEKGALHPFEKRAIGIAAARMITEGMTVMMNAGSTTIEILKALRNKRVRIITNSAAAAAIDELDPNVELIVLGGEFRQESRSFSGEMTVRSLEGMFSDMTFLGADGLSLEYGLTTSVYQIMGVNRLMLEHCRGRIIVVADASKFGTVSNFISAKISEIDAVITDDTCPPVLLSELRELGIETRVVSSQAQIDHPVAL